MISHNLKTSKKYARAYAIMLIKILGMINRTMVRLYPDNMVILYKSLVRPHVEYCTAAWSLCRPKQIRNELKKYNTGLLK